MQSHTVVEVDKISHSLKNNQNRNVFLVNNTKNNNNKKIIVILL